MDRYRRYVDIFLTFLWITVLALLAVYVYKQSIEVNKYFESVNAGLLVGSLLLGSLCSFPLAWIILDYARYSGSSISWKSAYILAYLPALGKYIPGKIWAVGSYVVHAKSLALISYGDSIIFQIYNQIMGVITSLMLALAGLLFVNVHPHFYKLTICILILFIAIPILYWLLRKYSDKFNINIPVRRMKYHIIAFCMQKVGRGLTLVLFISAFMPTDTVVFELVLAFIIASQLGVLAFFAPAGLGVTEGAYIFILSDLVGMEVAVIVAILARIWATGLDLILGVTAWFSKLTVASGTGGGPGSNDKNIGGE